MPIYRVLEPALARRQLREWWRSAARTFALLLLTLVVCAVGLAVLDNSGKPWLDRAFTAVWNSVNLISTLGDFQDFDTRQRVFMLLTIFGFLIIGGYAVSRLTGILSSDAVLALRENKVMERRLEALTQHVIVVGFGALGRLVATRLRDAGSDVVAVDRTQENAAEASNLDFLVVQGDAGADNKVLDLAGVDRAAALVVTTEDPDRKLAITLMAHSRNPALKIAVTGSDPGRGELLRRAGASEVVIADEQIAAALVTRLGVGTATKASGG